MNVLTIITKRLTPVMLAIVMTACGGSGSGEKVQQNAPSNDTDGNTGVVYNGPNPETDDVQNFKINVWDNLASPDRCGACHAQGGQGTPAFVRTDDINLAYAAANSVVDLAVPQQSLMVSEVAAGHNCWRPDLGVCETIMTNYIRAWSTASGAEANQIVLTAPEEREVGNSKSFPSDSGNFATTVYTLTRQYCVDCHSEDSATQQQPFLASADIDVAYQASRTNINLDTPENSRLVSRLRNDSHNCWNGNCVTSANEMTAQIAAFADNIPLTEVDPDLRVSRALGLPDGIVASTGGRFESNAIALYEFRTGSGLTAFDTSGVDPALDLSLTGNVEWIGSWGIRINDGRAQGPTSSSRKLHDLIKSTGEFSIEAWVAPDNVTQDGPARIVTYSGSSDIRNFTLGQTLYDYNFLARHSDADNNGMPMLSTPADDEVLQATLQHVVANFDPINGRSIYVNGERVTEATEPPGNINDWDDTFAFAIGNEVDNQQLWMGTMRLLAIHNRVLSEEEILNNFEIGVGQKFFLMFGVSHYIDVPQAYIVFEVEQFDNYSYLFNKPFFISLDGSATPENVQIQGLRIGVNGRESPIAQSFANLDITIDASNYNAAEGTPLSDLGALVPIDKGPDDDLFFLSFDRIQSETYARPQEPILPPNPQVVADEQSDIGVRTFAEVNATLSQLTTVPATSADVAEIYNTVRQQLPTVENLDGFLSSHQSGVMQLTVGYCTSLVSDTTRRQAFFPGFNFDAAYATAFAGANEALITEPLVAALLAHDVDVNGTPTSLVSQPDAVDLNLELENLLADMSSSDTPTAVIAACASAFGSAVMLVQ